MMAATPAIAAVSQTVLSLLHVAADAESLAGLTFAHYHVKQFESPMADGVSLVLYRVDPGLRRNLPPRVTPEGIRYLPPLPVDLHYILTAWAGDPVKQQRLLGWAMRVLEDTPVLPSGLLNQHAPEPGVFRADEAVELVWEMLSLQDWVNVWDGQRTRQPSVAYMARAVLLDSKVRLEDYAEVQVRDLVFAQVDS
jgi:hypothetical protein